MKAPLIHQLASERASKATLPIFDYNPETLTTEGYKMGGQSTACSQGTDGTEPKNEADQVMDDY